MARSFLALSVFGLLFAGCAETNPRLDCGDGELDPLERCDDGNRSPGDGCDEVCKIEPGYSCFGEPSVCQTGCGDGLVAGQEECDDGNLLDSDGCSSGCAVEPGYTCTGEPSRCESFCGDGALAATEECDDGNLLVGDGCDQTCRVEGGWVCVDEPSRCERLCGNGVIDSAEECDGALLDGQTCTTVPGGFTGGTLACSGWCTFDIAGCISPGCGNQIIDSGEMCDDGNLVPGDGCTANCQVETGWACTGEPSQCERLCGNGVIDSGEDCDGVLLGGATCATVPGGFTAGELDCTAQCGFDTSGCTTCGNNVPETGEGCDDGNVTAGDGCSPTCEQEDLPVLYWATGDPAVWGQMTVTYAGEPHAPQDPIVAAANADQRDYAYVFTATSYHLLSLPGHQWIGHGLLSARFPEVPGAQLRAAIGISWPAETHTAVALVTVSGQTAYVHVYNEDNLTGEVVLERSDVLDWSSDPNAPDPVTGRAAFQTLSNTNGWSHHDVYALCHDIQPATPTDADVGLYLGLITTADQLYLQECGYCWLWYDQMPTAQFPPFTVAGAPASAGIVAAFYSTEHGERLYVVVEP